MRWANTAPVMYCSPKNSQCNSSIPLKKKYKIKTETKHDLDLGYTLYSFTLHKCPVSAARSKINHSIKMEQQTVATQCSSKSATKQSPLFRVSKESLTNVFLFTSFLGGKGILTSTNRFNFSLQLLGNQHQGLNYLSTANKALLYLSETRTSVC